MTVERRLDVVVPIHDLSRPIARCVDSVLSDALPGEVRVTVVAHGIDPDDVVGRLSPSPDVRVVGFADGIRSSSGPFNHGLSLATAEYVAIIGSDDFLEPGALRAWLDHVAAERPDVLLAGLRYQDGAALRNPLARRGRTSRLDAVKDRLFYRTAPLGLLRREILPADGPLDPTLPVGADLHLSTRLWLGPWRIDHDPSAPRYVIGDDAVSRVTTTPRPVEETLRSLVALSGREWVRAAGARRRRSLAVKLLRIHVVDAVRARPSAGDWTAEDIAALRRAIDACLEVSPDALAPFSRSDRALIDALRRSSTGSDIELAWGEFGRAARVARIVPRNPLRLFDREGTAVRYLLYRLEA